MFRSGFSLGERGRLLADGWGPPPAQLVKHWAPAHGNEDGHYYICIGTGGGGRHYY